MKYTPPTDAEYIELVNKVREAEATGNRKQRDLALTLILRGLDSYIWRFVQRRVRNRQQADKDDCYCAAVEAILRNAIPRYDQEKAVKTKSTFANYASWWIKCAVNRHAATLSVVQVPEGPKRREAYRASVMGEPMTDEQRMYAPDIIYWDNTIKGEYFFSYANTYSEYLAYENGYVVENQGERSLEEKQVAAIIKAAAKIGNDERDRDILLEKLEGVTLNEIAAKHGICRERARQICNEMVKKLSLRLKRQVNL